ncbi:MAG: hypothetical protein R3E32_21065 [Chitinophagales bacterium]
MATLHTLIPSNKKLGLFLMHLIVSVLTSCDPMQSIVIENKTNENASIKFVFKKGSEYLKTDEFAISDTLRVNLDATENNRVKEYDFGIGTWRVESSFDSLVLMTKRIEISTSKSKQIIEGEEAIRAFFKKRIVGSQNERIEIELE